MYACAIDFISYTSMYVFKFCAFPIVVNGASFPRKKEVWKHPLRQTKDRGHYSVVSGLMLQHGPQWAMKNQ